MAKQRLSGQLVLNIIKKLGFPFDILSISIKVSFFRQHDTMELVFNSAFTRSRNISTINLRLEESTEYKGAGGHLSVPGRSGEMRIMLGN